MRENGIEEIKIQNFKAFQQEKVFEIGKRNVLAYGPNGSGKSSLYWALYTLFQCSSKSIDKIEKYFNGSDENLLNINEPGLPAYIEIKTIVNGITRDFKLDNTGVAGDIPNLKELNLASEFISHRLLINFYNFRNSKEINLFDVFDRDILPYVSGENNFKDKVLSDVIKQIDNRITRTNARSWRDIKSIERNDLENLNREIARLVEFINNNATQYLEDNFSPNDLKIKLTLQGIYHIGNYFSKGKKKYYLVPPSYKLSIESEKADGTWQVIDRPQSYLNEARLTRIGVAIRFCLLQKRLQNVPLKILALDDMLISLDLENRVALIKTILRLYKEEYQLFIFTHEKGFYNEVRRSIADENNDWKIIEFLNQENQQVRYRNAKTEIQRARTFLEDGDLANCALELRKLGEIIFRNFLDKKETEIFKTKDFVSFSQMLNEAKNIISESILSKFQNNILELNLTPEEWILTKAEDFNSIRISPDINNRTKNKIFRARTALFETAEAVKMETSEALKYVEQVRKIKDRLLNYGTHPTDDTLYATEMEEAMNLLEKLQSVLSKV